MKPRMKRKYSDTVLAIQFVLMSNLFIEKKQSITQLQNTNKTINEYF